MAEHDYKATYAQGNWAERFKVRQLTLPLPGLVYSRKPKD